MEGKWDLLYLKYSHGPPLRCLFREEFILVLEIVCFFRVLKYFVDAYVIRFIAFLTEWWSHWVFYFVGRNSHSSNTYIIIVNRSFFSS